MASVRGLVSPNKQRGRCSAPLAPQAHGLRDLTFVLVTCAYFLLVLRRSYPRFCVAVWLTPYDTQSDGIYSVQSFQR